MDWIVFGDDFGSHPSTTQHLALNLPAPDRVVWVNSIGMRAPGLGGQDFHRLVAKAKSMIRRRGDGGKGRDSSPGGRVTRVVEPRVLPFHRTAAVRRFNRAAINASLGRLPEAESAVLASNPVAVYYLPQDARAVVYLRLDDYSRLPGVDSELVAECEQLMIDRADAVVATARGLIPVDGDPAKWTYLEQGVDWKHFAGPIRATEPGRKVLGFFGLLAEWLDYDLIVDAARALEDWTFMMVGPVRQVDARLKKQANVEFVGPVPYEQLPEMICGWTAAWVPFQVNELTESVNPLKLRESLAAGLPTLVTPMPEALRLRSAVHVVTSAEDVAASLRGIQETDSLEKRQQRSAAVRDESWSQRAAALRDIARKAG